MVLSNRLNWETLRKIDTSTLGAGVAYFPVGGRLKNPSYITKMINNSNTLVTVSIDGLTDIDVLPPDSFFLYDQDTSALPTAVSANTQFYVKGVAGVGFIYLVTVFIDP